MSWTSWTVCSIAAVLIASPTTAQVRTLPATPTCDNCKVVLQPIVSLQAPGSVTGFSSQSRVTRADDGRFYVAPLAAAGVMVFDPAGRFERVIVSAQGQGPGEVGGTHVAVFALGSDTIALYDLRNARRSLFTAAGTFITSTQMQPATFASYLALRDGRTVLVRQLQDRPGRAIHLTGVDGRITTSFGVPRKYRDDADRMAEIEIGKGLSPARDQSHFWAYDRLAYGIELYDLKGSRLMRLERNPAWFDRLNPASGRGDLVLGVAESSDGLWIAVFDGAQEGAAEVATASGAPARTSNTVLELLDTNAGTITARGRFNQRIRGFVSSPNAGNPEVFMARELPDGDIAIDIHRVLITR